MIEYYTHTEISTGRRNHNVVDDDQENIASKLGHAAAHYVTKVSVK